MMLVLIAGIVNAFGEATVDPDPSDYSECSFFAKSPAVVEDAECVEDGEVIRWLDSRYNYFSH